MTGAGTSRLKDALPPSLARRSISFVSSSLLVLLYASNGVALTRRVPSQYPSIQQAIMASVNGDTILVSPGTYVEHLDFLGKDVVVGSLAGPETTIVDGSGSGSVVNFDGCGEGAQLQGLTIRGGGAITGGGGIYVRNSRGSGPSIMENWITANAGGVGGGALLKSSARLRNNRIAFNTAALGGAGVYVAGEEVGGLPIVIEQNDVISNRITGDNIDDNGAGILAAGLAPYIIQGNLIACNEGPRGAGLHVNPFQPSRVESNTVVANWGHRGVGGCYILMVVGESMAFLDNIIAFNLGGGIECRNHGGQLQAACNDIVGNNPDFTMNLCSDEFTGNDNLSEDPLFGQASGCPPADGDFCLSSDSPLLPEHSPPGCGLIGARGLCSPNAVGDLAGNLAGVLRVFSARPNPFFERTTIAFYLPAAGEVEIAIYGVLGRKVRTVLAGALRAGDNELEWDGRGDDGEVAASGAYVAVIRSGGREVTRTLLLAR